MSGGKMTGGNGQGPRFLGNTQSIKMLSCELKLNKAWGVKSTFDRNNEASGLLPMHGLAKAHSPPVGNSLICTSTLHYSLSYHLI